MPLQLNYYYGNEAEQYTFYRIPKILFTDPLFKGVSVEAKVLYGLLLDRMGLSVKNNWLDGEGRVYIIFTIADVMAKREKMTSSICFGVYVCGKYCFSLSFLSVTCTGTVRSSVKMASITFLSSFPSWLYFFRRFACSSDGTACEMQRSRPATD